MPSTPSRRAVLRAGSAGLATSLAGCHWAGVGSRPKLTVTAYNFDDETHQMFVSLFREDRAERSEALAFDAVYRLPGRDAEDSTQRTKNAVASRPYLVRVEVDADVSDHFHFHPDCEQSDGVPEELHVQVHPTGEQDGPRDVYVEFMQNTCSRDAGVL